MASAEALALASPNPSDKQTRSNDFKFRIDTIRFERVGFKKAEYAAFAVKVAAGKPATHGQFC